MVGIENRNQKRDSKDGRDRMMPNFLGLEIRRAVPETSATGEDESFVHI